MFDSIKLGFNRTDDREETFRQLQHDMDFQILVRERMREAGKEDNFIPFGHPVLKDFAKKLMPDWKPRYRSLPFVKWRTKAKAIAGCADPLSTMRKFTELRGEMEYLAEAIDDAHETFWGWGTATARCCQRCAALTARWPPISQRPPFEKAGRLSDTSSFKG